MSTGTCVAADHSPNLAPGSRPGVGVTGSPPVESSGELLSEQVAAATTATEVMSSRARPRHTYDGHDEAEG